MSTWDRHVDATFVKQPALQSHFSSLFGSQYLMSSKFSHMDLLNQYFLKMRDSILELELENTNLKKSQNGEIDKLRKEFISLFERHSPSF